MRHLKGNKKLGKPTDQRMALLRNLVVALVEHKRITTTVVRAKEAKRMAEKLITFGLDGSLHARRQALKMVPHAETVRVAFVELAPKYAARNGGYTKISKIGTRRGDAAEMSVLEFVD